MILYTILGIFCAYTIYYYFTRAGPSRQYNTRLDGKIVIITGASAGVGKCTASKLASLGATVIFACRDRQKTLPIIDQIKKSTNNPNLEFLQIDLANYDSVNQFAKIFRAKYHKIDLLINNAGTFSHYTVFNQKGHNFVIAANHLGHFLLTHLLQDLLVEKSRVINLSSEAHFSVKKKVDFQKSFYDKCSFEMYAISKYANVLFTQGLQKKFNIENRNIKVVSVHPGFVRSEIFNQKNLGPWAIIMKIVTVLFRVFMLTEEEGAYTTIYTALQPFEELVPSGYYQKNNLYQSSKLARTSQQDDELWDISKQELNIK